MNEHETRIRFADPTRINPEPLLKRIQSEPHRYRLNSNTAVTLSHPDAPDLEHRLAEIEQLLAEIALKPNKP